jgi:polysaccharide export outer membrane protein
MTENKSKKMTARLIPAFLFIVFLAGCASNGGKPPQSDSTPVTVDAYRIGVDDVLQVSVWKNPDLSVKVPVRPDGMISMPLAGDIMAGGRTPEEVAKEIEIILGQYLREPKVAVIVSELKSHEYLSRIRVTGSVAQPNSFTYRQGMTVLDAVLASGGCTEFASENKTKLYRRTAESTQVYDIRLGDILKKGDLRSNYVLQPGDVITVPERKF